MSWRKRSSLVWIWLKSTDNFPCVCLMREGSKTSLRLLTLSLLSLLQEAVLPTPEPRRPSEGGSLPARRIQTKAPKGDVIRVPQQSKFNWPGGSGTISLWEIHSARSPNFASSAAASRASSQRLSAVLWTWCTSQWGPAAAVLSWSPPRFV